MFDAYDRPGHGIDLDLFHTGLVFDLDIEGIHQITNGLQIGDESAGGLAGSPAPSHCNRDSHQRLPEAVYSHCLFCHSSLGGNREMERLPTGRRIAFDQAKGRLWVVCQVCARWNLVPFEDRWETIEDCARRFRDTVVRVSTDNVGLCRLPDGLELVRIGKPLRPEFAAWRYGHQFRRRQHRKYLHFVARTLGAPALIALGPLLAVATGPIGPLLLAGAAAGGLYHLLRRPELVLPDEDGGVIEMSPDGVRDSRLIRDDTVPDGWALMIPHIRREAGLARFGRQGEVDAEWTVFSGNRARLAASLLLPKVNPLGGDDAMVGGAVKWIEASGGPERAFRAFARSHLVRMPLDNVESKIVTLHSEVRLALEMALHEDEERRALAGELSVLEWVWRHEEMLADLADGLGIPSQVEDQLEAIRGRQSAPPCQATFRRNAPSKI